MKYVYILRSIEFPDRHYVGVTDDLRARLAKHNAGAVTHTSKYAPWQIKTYLAFSDETQAFVFEKYLKTASGRAFATKRLSRPCAAAQLRLGKPPRAATRFADGTGEGCRAVVALAT